MQRNHLAGETSPYLLQHAENPVDWYPWGEAALALARRENKPILLSVGYSACHWCHVMAHESFEDPGIARSMNQWFVNIKVDREERPDLDKIYQVAQQLITQRSGGWPLTMFLSPEDQRPFFGGTYFPKEPRYGMPGFGDILKRVAEYFSGHAAEIRQQNAELALAFERLAPDRISGEGRLDEAPLIAARRVLEESFDAKFGGFGRAPKFPQPSSVERCLRHWLATSREANPDLKALYMATLALTRMAEGGIFDQLGGGFSRYSVDDFWMIPHFEKMLYDNGQLLALYAGASLATGEKLYARVAADTADWILRDMRSPAGGFYSSLDADSEGHEGKFYVWSRAEVEAQLTPAEYTLVARRFGLDKDPNFEGQWHLHTQETLDDAARGLEVEPAAALETARAKLLAARNLRIWPARDEKILTSWNALTIKGLAIADRALDRPDYTAAATAAVDFIHRTLWHEGRLLATAKDGRAHLGAYLDDYAFLADALLELLQNRWRSSDLKFAVSLIDVLLAKFEDSAGGGFFFTASDHEQLMHRGKSFGDDSVPSGNAVAASVLCRMGHLLGELRYLDASERTLLGAQRAALHHPQAHMSMLNALEEFLTSPRIVIIRGGGVDLETWPKALHGWYAPMRMIFAIPRDAAELPPALAEKRTAGVTTAYVCKGLACSPPVTDFESLARLAQF